MKESKRKSGILLHISSLPSRYGVGDLGSEAYRLIRQLASHGFSVWQMLPLGPHGPGNSPYQAFSAYAGNIIFISPDLLVEWGILMPEDTVWSEPFSEKKVEYDQVTHFKSALMKKAWERFQVLDDGSFHAEFHRFVDEHNWWLHDYALYKVCRSYHNDEPWNQWPVPLAKRDEAELERYGTMLADEVIHEKFIQFIFFRQWFKLKNYAEAHQLELFGDLPLYVAHDSADVWANQQHFLLDDRGEPLLKGGVPPDYFSEDGQLWGNPVYNWEELKQTDYHWWIARLYFNFHLYHLLRIDHFRGLESFWAIPADADTARTGEWMRAHGDELLGIMKKRMGDLPIIAEDLGIITSEVVALRLRHDLPGMKVLQFAFESDESNEHLPHNFHGRNVVYTGTHDNSTLKGWWKELNHKAKKLVRQYVPHPQKSVPDRLIELAWSSTAEIAIVPMQDLLKLDAQARMNIPGTATGNWTWRCTGRQLKHDAFKRMQKMNKLYNRYNEFDLHRR